MAGEPPPTENLKIYVEEEGRTFENWKLRLDGRKQVVEGDIGIEEMSSKFIRMMEETCGREACKSSSSDF